MPASQQEHRFGGCQAFSHLDGLRSASCAAVGLPEVIAEATFGYKGIFATMQLFERGRHFGIVEEEMRTASKRKLEPKLLRDPSTNVPVRQKM